MDTLHVSIDGFLALLILLLPLMGIALGWLLRDKRDIRKDVEQKK